METNKPAALGEKYDTFFENDFIKIDTQIIVGNNGGADFLDCLCFREFADEYYKIDAKYKMNILELMEKNKGKYNINVYLTDCCNEYIEK
jgi:hypothetical protein